MLPNAPADGKPMYLLPSTENIPPKTIIKKRMAFEYVWKAGTIFYPQNIFHFELVLVSDELPIY